MDRDLLEGHMGIVEPTHLDKIVEQMHLLKVYGSKGDDGSGGDDGDVWCMIICDGNDDDDLSIISQYHIC